jgi:hypothetical protein
MATERSEGRFSVFAMPLVAGGADAVRRMREEVLGPRRSEYEDSRLRLGLALFGEAEMAKSLHLESLGAAPTHALIVKIVHLGHVLTSQLPLCSPIVTLAKLGGWSVSTLWEDGREEHCDAGHRAYRRALRHSGSAVR